MNKMKGKPEQFHRKYLTSVRKKYEGVSARTAYHLNEFRLEKWNSALVTTPE